MSIKLVDLADKSMVVQNKVEMNLISHNSTCDITRNANYFIKILARITVLRLKSGYTIC